MIRQVSKKAASRLGTLNPEGTVFAEAYSPASSASTFTPTIYSITDGTSNNRIQCRFETSGALTAGLILASGVTQCSLSGGVVGANVLCKVATAFKLNDFASSLNGGAISSDAFGSVPSVNTFSIGTFLGSQHLNNHIRRLRYYPKRLSNAQLQALTA